MKKGFISVLTAALLFSVSNQVMASDFKSQTSTQKFDLLSLQEDPHEFGYYFINGYYYIDGIPAFDINGVPVNTVPEDNIEIVGFGDYYINGVHYINGIPVNNSPVILPQNETPLSDTITDTNVLFEVSTVKEQSVFGEILVDFAKQYIGKPYVWGGNDLNTGVDCSGFTKQVYLNFGFNIERTSANQFAKSGTAVSLEDKQIGDLVFYGYDNKVSHVAIYIGNGEIIHAINEQYGIGITSIKQNLPLIGIKRIF